MFDFVSYGRSLFLTFAVIFGLSFIGCGSDSNNDDSSTNSTNTNDSTDNTSNTDTTVKAKFSGAIVDGYIAGATVFIDLNNNGVKDSGEPETVSDQNGNFSFDENLDSSTKYTIVSIGGTDIVTGEEFDGTLKSVVSSEDLESENTEMSVSPVSTLMQYLTVEKGISDNEAKTKMKNLFGLKDDYDFFKDDPMAQKSGEKTDHLELYSAGLKVLSYLDTVKTLSSDLGVSEEEAEKLAFDALDSDTSPFTDETGRENALNHIIEKANEKRTDGKTISTDSREAIKSKMSEKFDGIDTNMNQIREFYESGQISDTQNESSETSADYATDDSTDTGETNADFVNENYSKDELAGMTLADLLTKDDLPIKDKMQEAQEESKLGDDEEIAISIIDEDLIELDSNFDIQKNKTLENFNNLKSTTKVATAEDTKKFVSVLRNTATPIIAVESEFGENMENIESQIIEKMSPAVQTKVNQLEAQLENLDTELENFEDNFNAQFKDTFAVIEERVNAIIKVLDESKGIGDFTTSLEDIVTIKNSGINEYTVTITDKNGNPILSGENYVINFSGLAYSFDEESETQTIEATNLTVSGLNNSSIKAEKVIFSSTETEEETDEDYTYSNKMHLVIEKADINIADKYLFTGSIEIKPCIKNYYSYYENEEIEEIKSLNFDGKLTVDNMIATAKIEFDNENEFAKATDLSLNTPFFDAKIESILFENAILTANNLSLEIDADNYIKASQITFHTFSKSYEDSGYTTCETAYGSDEGEYSEGSSDGYSEYDSNDTEEYDEYADSTTEEYNEYATSTTSEYNEYVNSTTEEYNEYANSTTSEYNEYANSTTSEYNEYATSTTEGSDSSCVSGEYYSVSSDDSANRLTITGFVAQLKDVEGKILKVSADLKFHQNTSETQEYGAYYSLNSNVLAYFSGSYDYDGFKVKGVFDLSSNIIQSLPYEQNILLNVAVEPKDFAPYEINLISYLNKENESFDSYLNLKQDNYQFIAQVVQAEDSESLFIIDSNGVKVEEKIEDMDNLEVENIKIKNINNDELAIFNQETKEIEYSDSTTESIF